MKVEYSESILLNEHNEISLTELAELSGISLEELDHLVDSGALTPNNPTDSILHFNSRCVLSIRTLYRLKKDFELEANALSLMLVFLERIRLLEYQLSKHQR